MPLYDIFDAAPETNEPRGAFDRSVPLRAPIPPYEIARNVDQDHHVLYGYDGAWHGDPHPLYRAAVAARAKKERTERIERSRRALERIGITVEWRNADGVRRDSMEALWVTIRASAFDKPRLSKIDRRECLEAAAQDDDGLAAIYGAIADVAGWNADA